MQFKAEQIISSPLKKQKILWHLCYCTIVAALVICLFFPHYITYIIAGTVGGSFAFAFCLVALMLRPAVKQFYACLNQINKGEYLACWRYSKDHWDRFAKQELKRREKKFKLGINIMLLLLALIFILTIFLHNSTTALLTLSICAGSIFLIIFLIYFLGTHLVKHWKKIAIDSTDANSRIVYILNEAILRCYELISLTEFGAQLKNVELVTQGGDCCLLITIITTAGENQYEQEIYLPVPPEKLGKAEQICQKLLKYHKVL